MPDDDTAVARGKKGLSMIERTDCENRALAQTFCAAVQSTHDVTGIEPQWESAVEAATGDDAPRAGLMTQEYFNDLVDGKISPNCGFEIHGLKMASN